jgi:hypothetical protein
VLGIALAALPASALAATTSSVHATSVSPLAAIGKFQKAFLALNSYRSSVQTQAAGRTMTTTTEYVAPDRYHMMGGPVESITIGKDAWTRQGGRWNKIQTSGSVFGHSWNIPAGMLGQAQDPALILLLHGNPQLICNAKDLGMQDGYHAISCEMSSNGMSGTVTMWLRPDFLPAKLQVASAGNTTMTTYSDFNAPIVINQP